MHLPISFFEHHHQRAFTLNVGYTLLTRRHDKFLQAYFQLVFTRPITQSLLLIMRFRFRHFCFVQMESTEVSEYHITAYLPLVGHFRMIRVGIHCADRAMDGFFAG